MSIRKRTETQKTNQSDFNKALIRERSATTIRSREEEIRSHARLRKWAKRKNVSKAAHAVGLYRRASPSLIGQLNASREASMYKWRQSDVASRARYAESVTFKGRECTYTLIWFTYMFIVPRHIVVSLSMEFVGCMMIGRQGLAYFY